MSLDITHDSEAHRFTTLVEGKQCVLDYRLAGQQMTISHTGVPADVGGRGIASALTREAVETARAKSWKVTPACSYAAAWLKRHREYDDLLA